MQHITTNPIQYIKLDMKKVLFLSIILAFFWSCSDDNSLPNGTTPERTTLSFSSNVAIVILPQTETSLFFANVERGDNIVFEYFFVAEQEDLIADDEYAERIIFEITPSATSFSFTDEELSTPQSFFNRFCFCASLGSVPITSGTISGTKINDTEWDINIDVSFTIDGQEERRNISGIFRPLVVEEG